MSYNCEYPLLLECSHSHSHSLRSITNKFPLAFTTLEWTVSLVPLLLIAVKCSESIKPIESALQMMTMMRDEWGRGDENDKLEYLKDTHDWKQLQCAARIILI